MIPRHPSLAAFVVVAGILAACSSTTSSGPSGAPAPSASIDGDAGAGGDSAPEPNPLAEKVDLLFTEETTAERFAGAVVVVDAGKTVFTKAYGPADRKAKTTNAVDTVFRIGSLSKQFTAAAIITLASDGKLDVHDPVSKYFPEYPKASLTKDGVEVTLHHLLSHTSGLPDARQTDYFKDNVWDHPIDKATLIDAVKAKPLVAKPGTKFAYLNFNYFLLGMVVERVSGQSYEDFLHARLFEPFGMKSTGTIPSAAAADRMATGYYKTDDGAFKTMNTDPTFRDRDVTFAFGSGQIFSTVDDLASWDRALAAGKVSGEKVLFQPNLHSYGYGWIIDDTDGVELQWHNGAISPLGFSSYLARVPSKGRMIAYLSNLDLDVTQELETKVETLVREP